MIGVGVVTYSREEKFNKAINSINSVNHLVALQDGGKSDYSIIPNCEFSKLSSNKGVGFCKNRLIENLLEKGCEHIFILEDDCLVKDNEVWEYCISFSKESGLLHFNWNDYRRPRFSTAIFIKHRAALCRDTEANFSYFHRDFLKQIRFDENYINAWEHIDIEIQGEAHGFLPPFWTFVSPSDLSTYLEDIGSNDSSITGKENYEQRVVAGHHFLESKWGKKMTEIPMPTMNEFYEKMKQITIKYAKR